MTQTIVKNLENEEYPFDNYQPVKKGIGVIVLASINATHHHRGKVCMMCAMPLKRYENINAFAPTEAMVKGHKRYKGDRRYPEFEPMDDEEYTIQYINILDHKLERILRWLVNIAEKKLQITLCCFCAQGAFCHRRILAEYLQGIIDQIGLEIQIVLH